MNRKANIFAKTLFFHNQIAKYFCYGCELGLISPIKKGIKNSKYFIEYARNRTFELCANEILNNNLKGDVAEAGVAFGDFASIINAYFPDKNLYLYDTFKEFNLAEMEYEISNSFITKQNMKRLSKIFKQSGTSEITDKIKKKMKAPDKCVFRIGYFPETAQVDGDKIFSFVSIDLDLYKPIYNAIMFFYPRLEQGGYIFIHDYNSLDGLDGVKRAVTDAEKILGHFSKVPVPDNGGTLVITKPL